MRLIRIIKSVTFPSPLRYVPHGQTKKWHKVQKETTRAMVPGNLKNTQTNTLYRCFVLFSLTQIR